MVVLPTLYFVVSANARREDGLLSLSLGEFQTDVK